MSPAGGLLRPHLPPGFNVQSLPQITVAEAADKYVLYYKNTHGPGISAILVIAFFPTNTHRPGISANLVMVFFPTN